jgi:hypothetical protein
MYELHHKEAEMTLEETECLQAENERLLDENERLTQIGARRDPHPLVSALAEYLDWNDDPNGEMSRDAQAVVARHLRHSLNERLHEMRR